MSTPSQELWSSGFNGYGQLGTGDVVNYSSPVQIGNLTDWAFLSSGTDYSVAAKFDNTIWSWGYNSDGQLGLGDTVDRSSPVQIGSLTSWTYFDAGQDHTLALQSGTLWAWGNNYYGELGIQDPFLSSPVIVGSLSSPVQVGSLNTWTSISAGIGNGRHSLAVKSDGTLWAWGAGGYGALGLGLLTGNESSPIQVGHLTDWLGVTASFDTSYVVKTDNTLWGFGRGDSGQLGIGNNLNYSSPVQLGSAHWNVIAKGNGFFLGIQTNGTLWGTGNNSVGQLGTGNTTSVSTFVQIGSLTDWTFVTSNTESVFALKTDGTMWSWGRNAYGELGLGDTVDRSLPVQVGSLNTWTDVSTGE